MTTTNLLCVGHTNLADKSTDVREEIEIHVDSRGGQDGIDDDTGPIFLFSDVRLGVTILLGDQGRQVTLEASSTATDGDDGDSEGSGGTLWIFDDGGCTRDNEDDMS